MVTLVTKVVIKGCRPSQKMARSCPLLTKNWTVSTNLSKQPNVSFHEYPSGGSLFVPCVETNGRTYMTKVTVVTFVMSVRVKLVAFPWQQWQCERSSMLRYKYILVNATLIRPAVLAGRISTYHSLHIQYLQRSS